ncbi:extracellular solute-binding protein [Actinophytocola sp.]|uniref:extracellular solute-binding protein n=1 Tax=Actinophytocola sp. TaxID=1872138 RepID=UPI003D69FEBC
MTVLSVGLTAALTLTACGSSSGAGGGDSATVVFAGSGATIQKVLENEVFTEFTAKTGIKVTYQPGTAGQNLAKVQASASSPDIDVYFGNAITHAQGTQMNLWDKIDPALVPSAKNTFPEVRTSDGFGVVFGQYMTGLEYNTKIFAEKGFAPPTSWKDLWDPAYRGHVALYDIAIGYTQDVLPHWAKAWDIDPSDTDALFEQVKKLKPQQVGIATAPPALATLLQQEAAWITYNSNLQVVQNADSGVPVEFVTPVEGAIGFENTLDVVKGAPHAENAQKLIDFMLGEDPQTVIAKKLTMAPVIPGLDLDADTLKVTGYSPDAPRSDVVPAMIDLEVANLKEWTDAWGEAFR